MKKTESILVPAHQITAVSVNHNTSAYMELMLRSLFAHHPADLNLSLTIYDNASTDDLTSLIGYANSVGVSVQQTGFKTNTPNNSHGEILSRFVLEHPEPSHYLFLDADVCFVEDNTLLILLSELENDPDAFGIGPRMSWDGTNEIPMEVVAGNPDIYDARLHPCCALVKNTPLFRQVVEEIGLSCAKMLWANEAEYLDTFKLMTKVMKTHGQQHLIGSPLLLHFFCVSYEWDDEEIRLLKTGRRDQLLQKLRQ